MRAKGDAGDFWGLKAVVQCVFVLVGCGRSAVVAAVPLAMLCSLPPLWCACLALLSISSVAGSIFAFFMSRQALSGRNFTSSPDEHMSGRSFAAVEECLLWVFSLLLSRRHSAFRVSMHTTVLQQGRPNVLKVIGLLQSTLKE